MPQHIKLGTSDFDFDLAQPAGWSFAPGDTITGNLVRKNHIVTPEATITLSFTGRAKVRIVVTRHLGYQYSKSTYRDESMLVNLHYLIFKGPLHLAENSIEPLTWPISAKIPLEPDGSLRGGGDSISSILRPNEDRPSDHTLPGSFSSDDFSPISESQCIVEYYLTANLRYQYGGRFHSKTAICPIRVRHPVSDTIKLSHVRLLQDIPKVVTSQRLLPGMENANLTFKERMQKLVRHPKVPRFRYSLYLTVPTAIQIRNPNPIPFHLELVPEDIGTSESLRFVTKDIRLECVRMCLWTFTYCKAEHHSKKFATKQDFGLHSVFKNLNPLIIKTGKENGYVNIGNRFQLKLGPIGLQCSESSQLQQNKIHLFPDFETPNIAHYNKIDYTAFLTIGGERIKHKFAGISTQIISPG